MIYKILTIYDSSVKAFAEPFYARSSGEGIRRFEDVFTSTLPEAVNSVYHKHPQDFFLFEIGEFDDEQGSVKSSKPISLANGANYIEGVPSKGGSAQAPKGTASPSGRFPRKK